MMQEDERSTICQTDKVRAETAETVTGDRLTSLSILDDAATSQVIPTQEDINAATTWWFVNHDSPPPPNLVMAFARHAVRSTTRDGEELAHRIRAAVTYAYMPMHVRKLLSEAASALCARARDSDTHPKGGDASGSGSAE